MKSILKKFLFSFIFLSSTTFATVTVNITSNLPTKAMTSYDLAVFVENKYLLVPGSVRSAGIFNEETITTKLYSSPRGGTQTYIDIYHNSQAPNTTFCILDVNLDPINSTLASVSWIKNEPWQPKPLDRTKPAKCSFSISEQTINIYINYTGEPN